MAGVLAALLLLLPVQGQRLQVCWQKLAIHASPHLPQAACIRADGSFVCVLNCSFVCVLNCIPCPMPVQGIKKKRCSAQHPPAQHRSSHQVAARHRRLSVCKTAWRRWRWWRWKR